jgi:predicted anti-sigma-YlaC factor YlaD
MKQCEKYEMLISAFLDNELDEEQQIELFSHLATCESCRKHLREIKQIKDESMQMKEYLKPPVETQYFWKSLYNRIERNFSWTLLIMGAFILLVYGIYELIKDLIATTEIPFFIKLAILFTIVGSLSLLISVLREKLFIRKFDRYKEIEK